MIFIHITVSVLSLIVTLMTAVQPSRTGMVRVYIGIILTISTGIALFFGNPTQVGRMCISGTIFLIASAAMLRRIHSVVGRVA